MRTTLATTLSAAGLYALVASCSTTVNGGDPVTSLAGLAGEWRVVDASAPALRGRTLTIAEDAVALPMTCDGAAVVATVDRQGRMSVQGDRMAVQDSAVLATATSHAPTADCTPDRDLAALVDARPRMVRVNDRTVDIRRGRQRVRIRKA